MKQQETNGALPAAEKSVKSPLRNRIKLELNAPIAEVWALVGDPAKMLWHEPNQAWASLDEEPNAFGLQQSLTLITLELKDNKTILNWAMHFNCENQEMLQLNMSSLEQAFNGEIAQQLLGKFGGKFLDSYVDGK